MVIMACGDDDEESLRKQGKKNAKLKGKKKEENVKRKGEKNTQVKRKGMSGMKRVL